jgi:hypothetical protein
MKIPLVSLLSATSIASLSIIKQVAILARNSKKTRRLLAIQTEKGASLKEAELLLSLPSSRPPPSELDALKEKMQKMRWKLRSAKSTQT